MIQPVPLPEGAATHLWLASPDADPLCIPGSRGAAAALTLAAVHAVTADDPVLLAQPYRFEALPAVFAHHGAIAVFTTPAASADPGRAYVRAPFGYVEEFVERPEPARARSLVESGHYLWSSGIYAVRASIWIDAVAILRPELFRACERAWRRGRREAGAWRIDEREFADCPVESIERAVMERLAEAGVEARAVPLETFLKQAA